MEAILASSVGFTETFVVVVYLLMIMFLGWLGYRRTTNAADYMVGGRQTHPYIMAMSYGATFISTSAIVGFGGVAGMFGMSLLWLVVCNIFVGIFISFVFLGGPTRKIGHRLDAHTFPELLGRRFQSKFIQVFAGLVIALFIPLYASAVLIGGCEFLASHFSVNYQLALLVFSILIAVYVVFGGIKGVMYTDALQGTIMLVSVAILLFSTYSRLGGVVEGHQALTDMSAQAFAGFKAIGQRGWTSMPEFGWGDAKYNLWWIVVSTLTLGVGIGVLAQPQLAVRFMTVKSKKELNRGVVIGGVFIMFCTGTAFTVGSLSNVYFQNHEVVKGKIISTSQQEVIAKRTMDGNKTVPCELLHVDINGDGIVDSDLVLKGVGKAEALMPVAEVKELGDGMVEIRPHATAFTRAVTRIGNEWEFNSDSIIPIYIQSAMPGWFGLLFLLTLLSAAMSTLSSQFHAVGTSIGRDVYEQITGKHEKSVVYAKAGIMIGIIVAMIISNYARGGYFIARATAIFFGLCLATFGPAYIMGLFCRWVTKAGAIASMIVGFLVNTAWVVLIKEAEAGPIMLVRYITGGKNSLLADYPNWPSVDPILIAVPISFITLIVVSLVTRKPESKHLDHCFE
ncbi:MAG: sodium:solute symporter family protein [Sedimentisphaerales bacterium]|nr:sodium:solute symporter family protein [Sedimentisphaerales bacterium]